MKRRHSRGDPGQIPFADLAMATLGPMAALMIIFLILASRPCPECDSCCPPCPECDSCCPAGPECDSCCPAGPQCDSCCPACPLCRHLSDLEINELAQKVREWAEKMENIKTRNQIIPTITSCEDFSHSIIDEIDGTPIIPPSLYDLCSDDVANVLEKAGLSQEKLNQLMTHYQNAIRNKYHRVATHIAKCVKTDEILEPTEKKIEFESCQTIPLRPNTNTRQEMTETDFFKDMEDIVQKLNEFPNYNRVDIFGHTDKRPIRTRCPNGAKNNRELSSLRVHAYLDGLERALKDNKDEPEFKPVYNRWIKGNLKIYAIGVGEKEPINKGTSETAYRTNRRIEIRFGIDRR